MSKLNETARNISEYYEGRACKNIKYGTLETIVGVGKMKVNGEWVDSVTYKGECRFTGKMTMFTKSLVEFENDFELL